MTLSYLQEVQQHALIPLDAFATNKALAQQILGMLGVAKLVTLMASDSIVQQHAQSCAQNLRQCKPEGDVLEKYCV